MAHLEDSRMMVESAQKAFGLVFVAEEGKDFHRYSETGKTEEWVIKDNLFFALSLAGALLREFTCFKYSVGRIHEIDGPLSVESAVELLRF